MINRDTRLKGVIDIFVRSGFSGLQSSKKQRQSQAEKNAYQRKIGILMALMVFLGLAWSLINKEVMPVIRSLARNEAKMIAIKSINSGVHTSLEKNKVTTQDLLFYDYNEAGEVTSWNVNSIMINQLCTEIAENIIRDIHNAEVIQLKIPLGLITGAHMFSNVGPKINVKVLPKGTANIDYKNQLRATGINQVNHVVWLEVEMKMQIIVPLSSEELVVQRRVVLVDKVISGKVPSHYLNIPTFE